MQSYLQVVTTTGSQEDAQRIAQALVERRLAACVQVAGPISSTYRWQGAIENSQEYLCIIKTTRERYAELEQALLALHPYDVPEILAVEVAAGHQAYLEWLSGEVRGE